MYQINFKNRNYDDYTLIDIKSHINLDNNKYDIDLIGLIDGDIINIAYDNSYEIIEESKNRKNIVGIAKIMNKTKYGFNRDVLYIFEPFNIKLPKFLVKIGDNIIKNNNTNILCKVNYHSWNKQYPRGNIVEYYGNYYEPRIYERALIDYRCPIKNIKIKKEDQNNLLTIIDDNIYKKDLTYNPIKNDVKNDVKNETNFILSIDPIGCEDIDDVISFEKIKNEKYKIGIHITDIIYYLKNIKNCEKLIENKISSLYTHKKQINMLPDFLAENICSLKSNFNKKVVSLFITIDESKNIENKDDKYIYEIGYNIINSNDQMSYEEAEIKYNNHKIIDLVKELAVNNFNYQFENNFDYHNVIEILMIITNNWIGNYLIKNNIEIPLRVHNSNIEISKEMYDNIEDENYKKFIKIFNLEKAEYKLSKVPIKHETLGVNTYTHFTSPIRRFIDIYIHNELSKIMRKEYINIAKMDLKRINEINEFNNNNKYLQYDLNKLYISYVKGNKVEKCKGYVIKILDDYKVLIYLKEYKMVLKGNVIDKKTQDCYNIVKKEDKIVFQKDTNFIIIRLNELVKCTLIIDNNKENIENKIEIYL